MAAAAAEFVRQLRTLMAVGELASRLAPLEDVPLVAVGHSLGWLHAADVPAEVIAADDEQACAWPRQSYVGALRAGHSATYAARLTCPVLGAFGDRDVPERRTRTSPSTAPART
jgi:hypothetical protein